jgi:GNAT superfamily N-acetyltransferase
MVHVRSATVDDVEACAGILARAFHDDPGTVIFEPDGDRRAAVLPSFFEAFLRASLSEDADIVVSGTPPEGLACWFGPERYGPSPDAMGAKGFGGVLEQAGPDATERLLGLIGELEARHERLLDEPHLRLQFFGVEPSRQGTGIGSALIGHGHARADELGLPCYLDTFTDVNVRYYRTRGYVMVETFTVDDVPAYAMVRPAQG